MVETATMSIIEQKIKIVEAQGFGEVIIKIKNGAVYRVINTVDMLVPNEDGSQDLTNHTK